MTKPPTRRVPTCPDATFHVPRPGRCWCLVPARRGLTRPVPCRRLARKGKITCCTHRMAEERAQAFKSALSPEELTSFMESLGETGWTYCRPISPKGGVWLK